MSSELSPPDCGCTDGTDPHEPADRGFICPHNPRGDAHATELPYATNDLVKLVRDGLWPGIPKGTGAHIQKYDPQDDAVTISIPGWGDGFVTKPTNVELVKRASELPRCANSDRYNPISGPVLVHIHYFKPSGKWYIETDAVWHPDPADYTGWKPFSEVVRLRDMFAVCMQSPLGFPQFYNPEYRSEAQRLQTSGLTPTELVAACKNIGYDLTCGACSAVFFTGVGLPHDQHTCKPTDTRAMHRVFVGPSEEAPEWTKLASVQAARQHILAQLPAALPPWNVECWACPKAATRMVPRCDEHAFPNAAKTTAFCIGDRVTDIEYPSSVGTIDTINPPNADVWWNNTSGRPYLSGRPLTALVRIPPETNNDESGEPPEGSRLWRCELELVKARSEARVLHEWQSEVIALLDKHGLTVEKLNALSADAWKSKDDKPLPEDELIDAAFPTESGRHDLYIEAMRLVGACWTKGRLVSLVNWLLYRATTILEDLHHELGRRATPWTSSRTLEEGYRLGLRDAIAITNKRLACPPTTAHGASRSEPGP